MWISQREYLSLTKQIEYWQERAEREQARADRIADEILIEAGRRPVSAEAIESRAATIDEMKRAAAEQLRQIADTGADDDGSDFISPEGFMTFARAAAATEK
jgi:hypothetical protein